MKAPMESLQHFSVAFEEEAREELFKFPLYVLSAKHEESKIKLVKPDTEYISQDMIDCIYEVLIARNREEKEKLVQKVREEVEKRMEGCERIEVEKKIKEEKKALKSTNSHFWISEKERNDYFLNKQMRTKMWREEIYPILGTEGIKELFRRYFVFEKIESKNFVSAYSYRHISPYLKAHEEKKAEYSLGSIRKSKEKTILIDEFKKRAEMCNIPCSVVDACVSRLSAHKYTLDVHFILKYLERKKIKKNREASEQGEVPEDHEIRRKVVVRAILLDLRKVFKLYISKKNLQIIKNNIEMYLYNMKYTNKEALRKGISTKSPGEKQTRKEFIALQNFMFFVIDYIFEVYVPFFLQKILKVSVNRRLLQARFFLKDRYNALADRWKEAYIKEHFKLVDTGAPSHAEALNGECPVDSPSCIKPLSLQVIPKKNGFRPIVRKDHPNCIGLAIEKKNNSAISCLLYARFAQLTELQLSSKKEKASCEDSQPNGSVLTLKDGDIRFEHFIKNNNERLKGPDTLYILKLDLTKYFCSIKHEKIKELSYSMIKKTFVQANATVKCWTIVDRKGRKRRRRTCNLHVDDGEFSEMFMKRNPKNSIIGHTWTSMKTASDVRKKLKASVVESKIRVKNDIWIRTHGISQGDPFSSIISSWYLALLDSDFLRDLKETHIIRYIDDFIVLSWSLEELETLLRRIEDSQEKTGISINYFKSEFFTGNNFPEKEIRLNENLILKRKSVFEWCGIFYHTKTLCPLLDIWKSEAYTPVFSQEEIESAMDMFFIRRAYSFYFKKSNPHRRINVFLLVKQAVKKLMSVMETTIPKLQKKKSIAYTLNLLLDFFNSKHLIYRESIIKYFYEELHAEEEKSRIKLEGTKRRTDRNSLLLKLFSGEGEQYKKN
ncbi:telomerase reverse transcriptase [Nematocida sp. LUAm2]|nr:telomerase reverse transcriptase [Nematocida sp. LUAm2]